MKIIFKLSVFVLSIFLYAGNVSAAMTLNLTVNPGLVPSGGSALISWGSSGASSCTVTKGDVSWMTGLSGTNRSSGPLTTNTEFKLTCIASGQTAITTSIVGIEGMYVSPTRITMNPNTSIAYGSSTLVSWVSQNYTSCSVTKSGSSWKTGTSGTNVDTGPLYANTDFVLKCVSPNLTHNYIHTVKVRPAVDIYVEASNLIIGKYNSPIQAITYHTFATGTPYVIKWTSSSNTTSCDGENFSTNGSKNNVDNGVSKSATSVLGSITYVLTCTGPGGTTTDSIVINTAEAGVSNPALFPSCGLDVAFVIDNSGSISQAELDDMKTAIRNFINIFPNNDSSRFSVTKFSNIGSIIGSGSGADGYFTRSTSTAISRVNSIGTTNNFTNWHNGLAKAWSTFLGSPRPGVQKLIIFASDGLPTTNSVSPFSNANNLRAAITAANEIKTKGARIVGFGIHNTSSSPLVVDTFRRITGDIVDSSDIITSDVVTANFADMAVKTVELAASVLPQICTGVHTPTNVQVTPGACGTLSMSVSWDPALGADSYNIYRDSTLIGNQEQSDGENRVVYVDSQSGIQYGTSYSYEIESVYDDMSSTKTSPILAYTPLAVCPLSVSCSTATTLPISPAGSVSFIATPQPITGTYSYSWDAGTSYQSTNSKIVSYTVSTPGPILHIKNNATGQTAAASPQCPYVSVAENSTAKIMIGKTSTDLPEAPYYGPGYSSLSIKKGTSFVLGYAMNVSGATNFRVVSTMPSFSSMSLSGVVNPSTDTIKLSPITTSTIDSGVYAFTLQYELNGIWIDGSTAILRMRKVFIEEI